MSWAALPCAAWDQRKETPMFTIPCPACGSPNTKAVGYYTDAHGHRHWLRTRRWDTCWCVLTGVQDADCIRQAKTQEIKQEEVKP